MFCRNVIWSEDAKVSSLTSCATCHSGHHVQIMKKITIIRDTFKDFLFYFGRFIHVLLSTSSFCPF